MESTNMIDVYASGKDSTLFKNHWKLSAKQHVHYDVVETEELFSPGNKCVSDHFQETNNKGKRCLVVIDYNVNKLYGENVRAYFKYHNIEIKILSLSATEEIKLMDYVFKIVDAMIDFGLLRRSEPVVAIGGGVLMDIVGFAASVYRRGIPYIRVPTTLMGLIDAGIGIKTGVNFSTHKNRLGSYYAPIAVYLDRGFLNTLDDNHIVNGISEILKIALVKDKKLFELLEKTKHLIVKQRMQGVIYNEIFQRAIQGMLEDLEPNFWENKLERLVDYGHSFSPKIEMKSLPELLHGEAVAIDMALSTVLSEQRGFLNVKDRDRVLGLINHFGLPITNCVCTASFLYECLEDTIGHRDGLQRLPLTVDIGQTKFINDLTYEEIKQAVEEINKIAEQMS